MHENFAKIKRLATLVSINELQGFLWLVHFIFRIGKIYENRKTIEMSYKDHDKLGINFLDSKNLIFDESYR